MNTLAREIKTNYEIRFSSPVNESEVDRLYTSHESVSEALGELALVREQYPHWTIWLDRVETTVDRTRVKA